AYAVLAPLLDGTRTTEELCEAARGSLSAPEVYHAVTKLQERGYLVEVSQAGSLSPEAAAFWESLGADVAAVSRRLSTTPVTVEGAREHDTQAFAEALSAMGVQVQDQSGVRVVLVDDYLAEGLDAYDRLAKSEGRFWMPVKPSGVMPWFGP